ncbi:hypothetical protein K3G39_17620 [Pontibacter sp. HSC-14F20]|uniref:hypothetical protein n=1 Tax=Pontibacter sp. HSC-14F20 TaxID=2864136 RepID=UPI001C7303BB|nr:hypothetical protein [Pontibacter sp. HSC-14F20]MBX0335058.1 hypothetical protein [Pontibacter sp. HSC-14F20]
MKKKRIYYGLAGILTILACSLQIMHVPFASLSLTFALLIGFLVQKWHVKQLEEKLDEYGVYQNKSVVHGIEFVLIAGTAILKIMHVPFSDYLIMSPLLIGILFQSWYIRHLESKINKLSQI